MNRTDQMKRVLIPALTLVLLFVLFRTDDSEPSEASEAESTTEAETSLREPIQPDSGAEMPAVVRRWPRVELPALLKFDPFTLPAALRINSQVASVIEKPASDIQKQEEAERQTERERLMARATALLQKNVSVVYQNESGTVALIDSRPVRVGDHLEEGIRIVEISLEGIVLQIED